jgi:CarD family transcriptional regulator
VSSDVVSDVYDMLNNHEVKIDTSTWNRRSREYMIKIKSGSIFEVADVLRALFLLKRQKNLSFGEKKMLDQCKDLLAEEIWISRGEVSNDVKVQIDSCFSKAEESSLC